MSDILSAWNALGDAWLDWLLQRSVVCAVTLVLIGGVVLLLRRRVSAHLPSRLLLLPLIVLVVPLERALPSGWPEPLPVVGGPRFDDSSAAIETVSDVAPAVAIDVDGARHVATPATPAETPSPAPSLGTAATAMTTWGLLVLLGAARLLVRQRHADRVLRRWSRPADDRSRIAFARIGRTHPGADQIGLRASPLLRSPVATGIFRPIIYLPTDLGAHLSAAQLRFVLLHEVEHVRRRDVTLEALTRTLQLAFFFHPGVWIASAALSRWREYACDEAALAHAGEARRTPIAEALFTLIENANATPRPAGAIAHLLSPREFMKNRLTRILDRSVAMQRRLTPLSGVALALVSVGALTAARAQQNPPTVVIEEVEPDVATQPAANDDVGVALGQATTWLLRTQRADGSWAIGADPAGKNQRDHNEVHVTGLAIRALLPGLDGDRKPRIQSAIERGAMFIASQQRDDGCFAGNGTLTEMYGHAQALRALCAVQQVRPDAARLQQIEAGVRYAEKVRNPYKGWRYQPRDGDNDSKITSLMLLALQEAGKLGIEIDESAIRDGRKLLSELTLEETGRTGFVRRGGVMSRFTTKKADFPGELSEEPTAMKLLVDFACGDTLAKSAVMRRAVGLLDALPPEWSVDRGSIDYAYWNFGAHAMAAVGGDRAEAWRERLQSALIPHRLVADDAAHWPAIDAWSHPGMEVYATASAMLALQALR